MQQPVVAQPQHGDPLQQLLACTSTDPIGVEALSSLYTSSSDVRGCLRLIHPRFLDALSVISHTFVLQRPKGSSSSSGGESPLWNTIKDSNGNAYAQDADSHTLLLPPFICSNSISYSGTALLKLLVAHAILENGSNNGGNAALPGMLADLLHNVQGTDTCISGEQASILEARTLSTVLALVQSKSSDNAHLLDSYTQLLSTICSLCSTIATAGERDNGVSTLVKAIVSTVMDISAEDTGSASFVSPLLVLLTRLLEYYEPQSLAALSSLECLRRFTRHVIKLLSTPSPSVTAPALHLLTRLLLHPQGQAAAAEKNPTPLTILADSLRAKLFDDAHISRTLVLISDLCLNCLATDRAEDLAKENIQVLYDISGVIGAIVVCKEHGVSNHLFNSTDVVLPAIDHLVSLAKTDRRYLFPLLHIINPILQHETNDSPLLVALTSSVPSTDNSETSALAEDPTSIVTEIFDIVLSGIEDSAYTVPQFTATTPATATKDSASPNSGNGSRPDSSAWPRVSSDESGCGWFINCSYYRRNQVVDFLASVLQLPQQMPDSEYWIRDLFQVISQTLEPLFSNASSIADSSSLDPFHIIRAATEKGQLEDMHLHKFAQPPKLSSIYSRYNYTLASYYWVYKPIIHFASSLASRSQEFYKYWHERMLNEKQGFIGKWVSDTCDRAAKNPQQLLGQNMYRDIYGIFAQSPISMPSSVSSQEAKEQPQVVASVATPSDSEHSSNPQSPKPANPKAQDVDMDDLRQAAAKAENDDAKGSVAGGYSSCWPLESTMPLVRIALIRQWARSCEAELAASLLQTASSKEEESSLLMQRIRQSKSLLSPELSFSDSTSGSSASSNATLLFGGISTPASLQRKHTMELLELRSAFRRRLEQEQDDLMDAEEEVNELRNEANQLKSTNMKQSAELAQKQANVDRLLNEHEILTGFHEQLKAVHSKALQDAREWKDECVKTRDHLEQSERLGHETRQQLLNLTDKQSEMQDSFDARQRSWEEKQGVLDDNIRRLESALTEAIGRVKELESQNDSERRINEDLRLQNSAMASKLSEYSKIVDSLHSLSRLPH